MPALIEFYTKGVIISVFNLIAGSYMLILAIVNLIRAPEGKFDKWPSYFGESIKIWKTRFWVLIAAIGLTLILKQSIWF